MEIWNSFPITVIPGLPAKMIESPKNRLAKDYKGDRKDEYMINYIT